MRGITRISVLTFLVVVGVSLTLVLQDTMEAQRVSRADRLVFQASNGPEAVKALLATHDSTFTSMFHLVIAGVDKEGPVAKDIKAQSFYTTLVYSGLDKSGGPRKYNAIFAPGKKPGKGAVNMFPMVDKKPFGDFKISKGPETTLGLGIELKPGPNTQLFEKTPGGPTKVTSGEIFGKVMTNKFGPRDKYTLKLIPDPGKTTTKPSITKINKSRGEWDHFLDKIHEIHNSGRGTVRKSVAGTFGDRAADFRKTVSKTDVTIDRVRFHR